VLAGMVAALALALAGVPAGADNGATYGPPFDEGPVGGGQGSFTQADDDGRIVLARIYPAPGPLNCPPGGAYAKYQVNHTLTGPISTVSAEFTEALVDPFVFAVLSARTADGEWLGSTQQRGPTVLDGTLELELPQEAFAADGLTTGDVLTIQFGLEMASACPHANFGTARFTQITVS
jgi:hypothetical protein